MCVALGPPTIFSRRGVGVRERERERQTDRQNNENWRCRLRRWARLFGFALTLCAEQLGVFVSSGAVLKATARLTRSCNLVGVSLDLLSLCILNSTLSPSPFSLFAPPSIVTPVASSRNLSTPPFLHDTLSVCDTLQRKQIVHHMVGKKA